MIYFAIDPGDRWTGLAMMHVQPYSITVETVVLDVIEQPSSIHDPALLIQEFDRGQMRVIVEDYRTRPVGHQSFGSGNTLRMLGAIEYATHCQGYKVTHVPPRDPKEGLLQLRWEWFDLWRRRWPDAGCRHWKHARSAWVALGFALIQLDVELARGLSSVVQTDPRHHAAGPFLSMNDEILRAPSYTFARPL